MPGLVESLPPGGVSLLAGYAALLVVPGPSMMVVTTASLASPTRGRVSALGVASGTSLLLLSIAHLWGGIGIPERLTLFAPLLFAITMFGIGHRLIRQVVRSTNPPKKAAGRRHGGDFIVGFTVAITNPLGLAFFSTAAIGLPQDGSRLAIQLSVCIFMMGLIWFSLVGRMAAYAGVFAASPRASSVMRFVAGAVLIAIATWTVLDVLIANIAPHAAGRAVQSGSPDAPVAFRPSHSIGLVRATSTDLDATARRAAQKLAKS